MATPSYKAATLTETERSGTFTTDSMGLDVLRKEYRGTPSRINAAHNAATPWIRAPGESFMFLRRASIRPGGPWWTLDLEFVGFRGGTLPTPIFRHSRTEQTAQLTTSKPVDGTVQCRYRAATLTATYWATSRPLQGSYGGLLLTSASAVPYDFNPPKSTLAGRIRKTLIQVNTLFDTEEVLPGLVWRVTEVWENQMRARGDETGS